MLEPFISRHYKIFRHAGHAVDHAPKVKEISQ
jgi:hypothetical protein